jgi:threonine dehydrogenase-like Zn-dependent dehydrogenase
MHLWDSFPLNDPDWAGRVAFVLDCSGHELAVLDGCRIVRRRGEVVLAGVPWKKMSDSSAHELLSLVFNRYVMLRSGWEWEIPRHEDAYSPIGIFTNLRTGMRWLSDGLLKVQPLTRMWSPSDAQGAYAGLATRRIRELFVVFDWQESNLVKGERL